MASQQPEFFSKQVLQARRFYLDLSPDKRKAFSVVCGGSETCLPNYEVDRTDFPYYSIEYVSRGKGAVTIGNVHKRISPGFAYTYGPGFAHKITSDQGEPLEKYFVDFSGKKAASLLDELHLRPGSVLQVHAAIELQRCLDDLILHGLRSSGSSSRLCDALMHYILVLVSSTAISSAHSVSPAYATYLQCKEHIEQQYMHLHSLDDTAREILIDKTYLCRLFRRFHSQTAHEYLTRLKMNKAAELLDDSDMLVKQVAFSVGYSDPFHFSRVFKSIFGVSPKGFRQLRG